MWVWAKFLLEWSSLLCVLVRYECGFCFAFIFCSLCDNALWVVRTLVLMQLCRVGWELCWG